MGTNDEMSLTTEHFSASLASTARQILREPFTRQAWSELLYLALGSLLAFVGLAFVLLTMAIGVVLAITFVGLAVLALSLRSARGLGRLNRRLANSLIGEQIEEPERFQSRKGFLGWLQAALRDQTGWRSVAYLVLKAPLAIVSIYAALCLWLDAFIYFRSFVEGQQRLPVGIVSAILHTSYATDGSWGTMSRISTLFLAVILLLLAPWAVRLAVFVDRLLMRALLSPDSTTVRVRSLEHARAVTIDESAATLRRIERDLHDGTQAQLVALAMRLGMAKEELALPKKQLELDRVRALVDMAHAQTKEIIVELRDLTRGIHPPALDVGLAGALTTLAARSSVPTDLSVKLNDRPTPAVEAIAYFCVAELLANVAQHADATRASISCTQDGDHLRLIVRDDGVGGARCLDRGRASSGLRGLTDRVAAVDGSLAIESPEQGPTVVTVDLPLAI